MIYNLKQIAEHYKVSKQVFRLATYGQWTHDRSKVAVGDKCLFQFRRDSYEFATLKLDGVNYTGDDEQLMYEFVTKKGDTLYAKFIPDQKLRNMLKAYKHG